MNPFPHAPHRRTATCRRALVGLAATILLAGVAGAATVGTDARPGAEPGVEPDRIVFGQSGSFSGQGAELALAARAGVRAAFDEINARGGVHGRRLELDSLDDGYDPERAIANTRQLIEERGVFAMIASFGTPTSEAVLPTLARAGVPYLGPISGAAFLREPERDNVVNLRPGYDDEAATWVHHLRADLGARRIAILYQNDAFGRTVLEATRAAMAEAGLEPVAEAGYEPLTVAVKQALLKIRKRKPSAVIMAGGHRPVGTFVRVARELDMDPIFVAVSVASSQAVFEDLGATGAGVVFTQVVPSLDGDATPIAVDYRRALANSDPGATPDPVGLEAYLTARLVAERLDALGSAPTRRALLDDIAGLENHELGGVTLSFGPDDNQGIDRAWLSVLRADGEVRYLERLTRAAVSGANR